MPKITYIEHGGTLHVVEVSNGMSVMEGAVRNDVPGIDGECGGACACVTCHVFVDESWRGVTGEPNANERDMIEFANGAGPGSRLSCQIKVSDDLDGLVVRMPISQH
jgi:ferredoxin, 2Fe-2S